MNSVNLTRLPLRKDRKLFEALQNGSKSIRFDKNVQEAVRQDDALVFRAGLADPLMKELSKRLGKKVHVLAEEFLLMGLEP